MTSRAPSSARALQLWATVARSRGVSPTRGGRSAGSSIRGAARFGGRGSAVGASSTSWSGLSLHHLDKLVPGFAEYAAAGALRFTPLLITLP